METKKLLEIRKILKKKGYTLDQVGAMVRPKPQTGGNIYNILEGLQEPKAYHIKLFKELCELDDEFFTENSVNEPAEKYVTKESFLKLLDEKRDNEKFYQDQVQFFQDQVKYFREKSEELAKQLKKDTDSLLGVPTSIGLGLIENNAGNHAGH